MTKSIDDLALQISERLLEHEGSDADLLVLDRLRTRSSDVSVVQQLRAFDRPRREQAGEFGIETGIALLVPLVVPAFTEFLKKFAEKFFEGAASKTGERAADAAAQHLKRVFSPAASAPVRDEVIGMLEREFAARAAQLDLGRNSYAAFVDAIRQNPELMIPD